MYTSTCTCVCVRAQCTTEGLRRDPDRRGSQFLPPLPPTQVVLLLGISSDPSRLDRRRHERGEAIEGMDQSFPETSKK